MLALMAARFWRPAALALLIAAAIGYRTLLVHQRDAARARAAHLTALLAEAKADNSAMQGAIAAQNNAVARLKARLARSASAAQARERTAATRGAAAMRRAAGQARAIEHQRMEAGCKAAIRWANQKAPELARW